MAAYTGMDAVITALLSIFDAATTATVDDGYIVSSETATTRVIVGGDGTDAPGELTQAAASTQTRAAFEFDTADEAGQVQCAILAETGDDTATSLATLRASTLTILGQLEAAVRADPSLGGVVSGAWISQVQLWQGRIRGTTVLRPFVVSFEEFQP